MSSTRHRFWRPRIKRRALLAVPTFMVAGLIAQGCAPGGTTDTGSGAQPTEPTPISTDAAAMGDVTVTMKDFWGGAESDWANAMIKAFEAKYPNIKIDRTTEDWGQLNATLNLQLQGENAPCIATANNGWASLGLFARGNLVLNLDNYASAYGWRDRVPQSIQRQNEFTADFTTMGAGSWFATPVSRVSLIGLYYNVAKLEALGIAPPTSIAELEAAAEAAKAAGEIPFSYGALDGSTAALLGVQATIADSTKLNDFIYGGTDVKAADVGMTEAVETIARWAKNGWFPDGFEGIDYQTGAASFVDGKGVFRWDYTGSLPFDDQSKFGYIQLAQAGGKTVGVGGAPGALVISTRCPHPDAAAAFLDFLMSPEAGQQAVDLGLVPALSPDVTIPEDKHILAGEAAGAAALDADDGYVPYFDWSSPTMLDTLSQNLQQVFAGRMTPQEFVAAVDADRDAFLAGQGAE